MKTMNKYFWMLVALLALTTTLTSCYDDDDYVGKYVSGHWFGDMDMYYDGVKALGSEIEFTPSGWGYTHGYGYEIDYYHRGSISHRFNWKVVDQVLYLTFDDPALDCAIVDYNLTYYRFTGCIADYYTLENLTYFTLRNYDRDWDTYGYGGYYDPYYYVKGEKFGNDSTGTNVTTSEPKGIRGVNMKKALENKE